MDYYTIRPSDEYTDTSAVGKTLQELLEASVTEDQRKADAERASADELRRMEEELT